MLRSSLVALALVLASAACKKPPTAAVEWADGGAGKLTSNGHTYDLPDGVAKPGAALDVAADRDGARFAVVVHGEAGGRVLYVVGDRLYAGEALRAPFEPSQAPDLDHALGGLFREAGARRAALVEDVRKAKGDAGVATMLGGSADVDAPEWDAAFDALPDAQKKTVRDEVSASLVPGKPAAGLRRAVAVADLKDARNVDAFASRVRELTSPVVEPRATAVLLRAVAALDRARGAALGCEVLGRAPTDTANAKGTPEQIDAPGREALAEAALLAVANDALASGKLACDAAAKELGDDHCLPFFRCGATGPLTGREASTQDEPLCEAPALKEAVARELARPAKDVLSLSSGTRRELFAYAALAGAGKVPDAFARAHARRRYALVQPKAPPCDDVKPGTACHCDEATVRDQTCRHAEGGSVSVGLCKFSVDDAKKKITDVVATPPP